MKIETKPIGFCLGDKRDCAGDNSYKATHKGASSSWQYCPVDNHMSVLGLHKPTPEHDATHVIRAITQFKKSKGASLQAYAINPRVSKFLSRRKKSHKVSTGPLGDQWVWEARKGAAKARLQSTPGMDWLKAVAPIAEATHNFFHLNAGGSLHYNPEDSNVSHIVHNPKADRVTVVSTDADHYGAPHPVHSVKQVVNKVHDHIDSLGAKNLTLIFNKGVHRVKAETLEAYTQRYGKPTDGGKDRYEWNAPKV